MSPTGGDPLRNEPRINGVSTREYIEALMEEHKRQADTAAAEREKAASALRQEQYRAMAQAEREREKAATVMRQGLERSQAEGDDRLREHIANQVEQIRSALSSAEKLEIQRMASAELGTEGLRREMTLITESSREAVKKAEAAQADVNAKNNEFRGQLADQASTLMPRREAESRASDLERRVEEARQERERLLAGLNDRLQTLERGAAGRAGGEQTTQRKEDRVQPWQLYIGGVVLAAVVILSNLLSAPH